MKDKLLDICERRMMEAEEARKVLVRTMWVPRHLIEFVNNYICAFQLELDRYIDTLLFVNDFYAGIITKMPCDNAVGKEVLSKIDLENPEIQKDVNNLLIKINGNKTNPFQKKVEDVMDKCCDFIDKTYNIVMDTVEKFNNLFSPLPGSLKDKKVKKPKKGVDYGFS